MGETSVVASRRRGSAGLAGRTAKERIVDVPRCSVLSDGPKIAATVRQTVAVGQLPVIVGC